MFDLMIYINQWSVTLKIGRKAVSETMMQHILVELKMVDTAWHGRTVPGTWLKSKSGFLERVMLCNGHGKVLFWWLHADCPNTVFFSCYLNKNARSWIIFAFLVDNNTHLVR